MTSHRMAWGLRAGTVVALVAGAIGVAVPTAAYAVGSTVKIPGQLNDFNPGESQQLKISYDADIPAGATITVTGLSSDFTISNPTPNPAGACQDLDSGKCHLGDDVKQVTLTFTVAAKSSVSVAAGASSSIHLLAKATDGGSASETFNLHGPPQTQPTQQAPTTVTKISGVVKDSATGSGIPGVKVELQDGSSNQFTTTSNNAGGYQFTSTSAKPIIAGLMAITATKDGFSYEPHPFNTTAGQPATFDIVMLSAAAPTASAAVPDGGISSAPVDSAAASQVVAGAGDSTGGSNHYLTFMIIAGALLILAGIGAILTLVLRRRREDDEEDEDDVPPPPRRGPPPGRPASAGYRPEPTVVARDPGYNDRTAIVAPIVEEYPDPYGAPPPRTPAPAYGGQRAGYDQPTTYTPAGRGGPDQYAGNGGRGARYDEPTGVYTGGTQNYAADPGYGAEPPGAQYGSAQYGGAQYAAGEPGGGQYGGAQYGAGQYGAGAPERGRDYDAGQYEATAGYPNGAGAQYGGGQYGAGEYAGERYPPAADPYRDDTRHAAEPAYGDPAPRSAPPRGRQYGGYDQAYDQRPGYDQQGYGEPRPTSGAARPTSGAPRPTSGAPRGGGYGQQYGGYDQAYDQRAGYDPDAASRHAADPARGGAGPEPRRSLDWLDD